MNDSHVKSCWNVTAWALAGFTVIMVVTYFVSSADRGEIASANITANG